MGKRYANYRSNSYVEKGRDGKFIGGSKMGASNRVDRRKHARRKVASGYGHQGDHKVKARKARSRSKPMAYYAPIHPVQKRFSKQTTLKVI